MTVTQGWIGRSAIAQGTGRDSVILNGRTTDSAGAGVSAQLSVRPVFEGAPEIAHGVSAADGSFHLVLMLLPDRVVVRATTPKGLSGSSELDSLSIRGSDRRPVVIHMLPAHALATVQVRARYQKRPSVYSFFEGEPSSRVQSTVTADWLDPLTVGDAAALFRASPEMLVGMDGSASVLGAPGSSNQVEIDGVQVPADLVTGTAGGTMTSSPWDVTIGGAAGATLDLFVPPSQGRYHQSYVTLRSGVGGVPASSGSQAAAPGLNVPLQMNGGVSGPAGKFTYSVSGFARRDVTNLARWDRTLGATQRGVIDSLSAVLRAPTVSESDRNTQLGVIGRLDLVPNSSTRLLYLTSALTHSSNEGGTRGGFFTGSLGVDVVHNVGLLQLVSTRVLRERVLLSSLVSTSLTSSSVDRVSSAPTIITTDVANGNALLTGGAPPQPTSRIFTAEARSTGTWYSRDNKTRYVAQLQARFEGAQLGARGAHSTFLAQSIDALQSGDVVSLTRNGGAAPASAGSFVFAPAIAARHDLGDNGSLLLGARADAWMTSGMAASGTLRYVDISPRVSYLRRLGKLSANRGPVATLRAGAGRFTSWPSVQQWADAWNGAPQTSESCSGADAAAITLITEAPSCNGGATTQVLGRTVAVSDLRPAASNRVDVSLAFTQVAPGIRGEIGAAFARNSRIAARLSPLMSAPAAGRLDGEDGRTLLVAESGIGAAGIVPVATVPAGVSNVTQLVSDGRSSAEQFRLGLGSKDQFARTVWQARYVFTTGKERTLAIAAPGSAPAFVSGPLSSGGRHSIAFSLSEWMGQASVQFSGTLRSGTRFTPIADRDLNGDGLVNDAVYIPASASQAWASAVPSGARSCITANSGRIAGFNSCTGPWRVSSLIVASVPGFMLGMARGSIVSLQISNPLGLIGHTSGVVFGNVTPVNGTLLHVTGFDAATHRFTGEPLGGFGNPFGLAAGVSDPVRLAFGVRLPLGPSVISQRAEATVRSMQGDTSTSARMGAAMGYLGDLPPVPLVVLQAGSGLQMTASQRQELQALGARWQASATHIVSAAYGEGTSGDDAGAARRRLIAARVTFMAEVLDIVAATRNVLTADQIDLLSSSVQRLLNPRFWKYISMYDAGTI